MAKAFPTDNPFLRGYYAPVNTEADAGHLHVSGELPKELCGTLYRNGPNPQFAPRGPYHWFGGDGMIHAFHLENGNVSYKNRWVRTPKWRLENQEGEALFGTFGNPMFTDPKVQSVNSTIANTNIVWHGGKLLALEEAHAPVSLDAKSLMPVGAKDGYETFGDKLCGPFTAHPKLDPKTGEMVFFGYSATGRFTKQVSIQSVTEDGKVTRAEILDGPYPSMIHDFAVTRNWIIVPIFPLTSSLERAMSGKPVFAWEPDKGTHIAFIPRNGSVAEARWIAAPPCYVFHPMNHFETADGKIVIDVMKYDVAPLFPRPDGSPASEQTPAARLFRWTFDLAGQSNTFREEQLDDRAGEFPRFDERFCMSDYRHGWIVSGNVADPKTGEPRQDGITHYDLATGKSATWTSEPADRFGEPIFVARGDDAPEGDGWVLSVIYWATEGRSDLAVFEATDIAKGPVALAHLTSRVPAGFHGNWRPGPL
ncbi:MAG: carotenoid oxygenase family protein [Alphaproteobacteria bacterium]|nr:carotenoid oxygenase family protein [Alphaproteobacteria bacterium]